ncbi:alkaline phosphatase family protein [Oceanobacter sp. RED65]|uniref:Alkaline phosphatase family protein n=2 Tax=Bermanella marisrubri TaxID=207949 RepID=Q1MYS5_9GAMM|nr:alkaline phosphatase family protein [Oceanobacter sp. RED65] [Bermanella marisrubri]
MRQLVDSMSQWGNPSDPNKPFAIRHKPVKSALELQLKRMLMKHLLTCMALPLVLTACDQASNSQQPSQPSYPVTKSPDWYQQGQAKVTQQNQAWQNIQTEKGSAKNAIFFVGDGMGISTITAARILAGQERGQSGEEYNLSFDQFPFSGLSRTYNVDAQTPDSAGTMTAMITGVKTDAGIISINEKVQRGNCESSKGNELISALELAEMAGLSTGIVTTARITHATPAAAYAKSPDRNWEDISDMPQEAIDAGCEDIASQLIYFKDRVKQRYGKDIDGIEVAFGGGRRHFLPKQAEFNSADAQSDIEGDRTDGRHLIEEWQSLYPQGQYIIDENGLNTANPKQTPILGLFNESHMHYHQDRHNDRSGEPSIELMTQKTIEILSQNEKGYLLIVESGRIDHGHHAGNAYNALHDTIALSKAVAQAQQQVDTKETLMMVTADHSHVFTMAGYPKRGNPILGKVVTVGEDDIQLADDGMPYTTLGYMNGRGMMHFGDETNAGLSYKNEINAGRHDLHDLDTTQAGYHQEALVPLSSETHGGEDVGIYAIGPGAHLVSGVHEQNVIFHILDHALNLQTQRQ